MKKKTPCSLFQDLRTVKIQFLESTWVYLTNFRLSEEVLQLEPEPAITCSKLTTETLEQGVEYVQS